MKLKRTKLAAAALTALMAVGAMSSFAYAEDAGDVASAVATSATGAYTVDESSIEFAYTVSNYVVTNSSMNVTYTASYVDDEGVTYTKDLEATAEIYEVIDATCTTPEYTILRVQLADGKYYLSNDYETAKALGHNYTETKRVTTVSPTDTTPGKAHVYYTCTRCGDVIDDYIVLEPTEHVYSTTPSFIDLDNILVDDDGDPILGADGLPQIAVPTADGSYRTVYYCVNYDGVDDVAYLDAGVTTLLATEGSYAKITYVSGVVATSTYGIGADDLYAWESYEPTVDINDIDLYSIELKKCTTPGYFIVTYYNNKTDMKAISSEKITIPAHHLETGVTIEFKTQDDADLLTVVYNTDGSVKSITNQSCYLTAYYYEVVHCAAANCPEDACKTDDALVADNLSAYGGHSSALHVVSKTPKEKTPDGDHVINTVVKTNIDALTANGTATRDNIDAYITAYETTNGTGSAYINIKSDTSDCENAGVVTIEYLCKVCKTVVKTVEYNVAARGHVQGTPTRDESTYVAPSCTSTGSYVAVTTCTRCGKVLDERTVTIPRTKHTNEIKVTSAGVGTKDHDDTEVASKVVFEVTNTFIVDPDDGEYLTWDKSKAINNLVDDIDYGAHIGYTARPSMLGAYVYAVSQCDVCGYEVTLYKDVEVYITSISKEANNGEAGTITLKLVYNQEQKDGTTKEISDTVTLDYFSTVEAYEARTEATYTGLKQASDGNWYYYVDSQIVSYTGIVDYQGGSFFVADGMLCSTANGLNLYNGTWYFLSQGQIQKDYTDGLALYDGEWFYITDGILDTTINGLVQYDGGWFLIAAGRLVSEANGLWQDSDGTWYFLSNGQVQTQYSGVALYDGEFFVVENGVFQSSLNVDEYEYDGAVFKVVNGQLYEIG
ncbi:MAG: hypothetical protein LIP11_01915 [Clostridiales bacterium]|nr:hypothetical protein [Clostridiales bacterium]